MQVLLRTWRGKREVELEEALTPSGWNDHSGVAERAQSDATLALECLGRLSALLVDKGLISIEEASEVMNISGTIERIR